MGWKVKFGWSKVTAGWLVNTTWDTPLGNPRVNRDPSTVYTDYGQNTDLIYDFIISRYLFIFDSQVMKHYTSVQDGSNWVCLNWGLELKKNARPPHKKVAAFTISQTNIWATFFCVIFVYKKKRHVACICICVYLVLRHEKKNRERKHNTFPSGALPPIVSSRSGGTGILAWTCEAFSRGGEGGNSRFHTGKPEKKQR